MTIFYRNEIRGVFVHAMSSGGNWAEIMDTLQSYNIDFVIYEVGGNNYARWDSKIIPTWPIDEVKKAITEAHARNMKLYVSFNVMLSAYIGDGIERRCMKYDGTLINWLCPTRQASRTLLKNVLQELVSNYDVDGFMYDYIRYSTGDECYCEECKIEFEKWLGETIVEWPGVFAPGGSRRNDFIEWRIVPVTNLVKDIRQWITQIKPNIDFGAAVWRWIGGYPTYWRYWIGQDWVDWVAKGYLNWVSPMCYVDDPAILQNIVEEIRNIAVGGPEGIIPLMPFIDTSVDAISTPTNFAQRIQALRDIGSDGWILWRYGGLGDPAAGPDIRDYLGIIDLFPIFDVSDIKGSKTAGSLIAKWKTGLPATSRIEYSPNDLFNVRKIYDNRVNFDYIAISKSDFLFNESLEPRIDHQLIAEYQDGNMLHYRVQSKGPNNMIATSYEITDYQVMPYVNWLILLIPLSLILFSRRHKL